MKLNTDRSSAQFHSIYTPTLRRDNLASNILCMYESPPSGKSGAHKKTTSVAHTWTFTVRVEVMPTETKRCTLLFGSQWSPKKLLQIVCVFFFIVPKISRQMNKFRKEFYTIKFWVNFLLVYYAVYIIKRSHFIATLAISSND